MAAMVLCDSHHSFLRNKSSHTPVDTGESLSSLHGPTGKNLLFQPLCPLSLPPPPEHRIIILPGSLLGLFLWQNQGDSMFFCGSHTVRNIPKIELFGPQWGVTFSESSLLVLFTAFSRI